jgi:hypothetical protein
MKNFLRVSAAGLALFASLGVFAAQPGTRTDGRRSLKLTETTEVLGATVPPGAYELRWARERGSDNVRLEVTRGGTVWAAGRGTWTSSDQPYPVRGARLTATGLGATRWRRSSCPRAARTLISLELEVPTGRGDSIRPCSRIVPATRPAPARMGPAGAA